MNKTHYRFIAEYFKIILGKWLALNNYSPLPLVNLLYGYDVQCLNVDTFTMQDYQCKKSQFIL